MAPKPRAPAPTPPEIRRSGWRTHSRVSAPSRLEVSSPRADIAHETKESARARNTHSSRSQTESGPRPGILLSLGRRYAAFRVARFGVATSVGFFVNEVILVVGIYALYRIVALPSLVDPSFTLTVLALNVVSLGIGDTVAFAINERVTVRVREKGGTSGRSFLVVRWVKYQSVAFTGNLVIAGVQLGLLAGVSLHPAFGDIVGAVVAYPMTYVVSMHFVWSVNPFRG